MEITNLKEQRNSNRVNVYIDDEFSFACYKIDILNFGLYKGKKLSDNEIREIKESDEIKKVYNKALEYLSLRRHSYSELEKKLLKKDFDQKNINDVLERLKKESYINDSEFAKVWVDERKRLKPKSKKALFFELKDKGVSEEIIQENLDSISNEEELKQAITETKKKFGDSVLKLEKNKVYSYLSRKGYSYEVVKEVIEKY